MKRITFPLKPRMEGPEVTELQAALQALLDRGVLFPDEESLRLELPASLRRESAGNAFGMATRRLIMLFQRQCRLQATGEVDEKTAQALNERLLEMGVLDNSESGDLPQFQHLVRGQIRYEDGLPIEGLKVFAYNRHLRNDDLLSQTTTDSEGHYEIYYSVEEFWRKGQRSVTLLIKVVGKKEGKNKESLLAESDVIYEAGIVEKVNLRVPGGIRHSWSEYEQLMSEVEPLLEGESITSLVESENRQDISYLAGKLGHDVKSLAQLVGAHKLAVKTKLPPEVLYGLARKKLPLKMSILLAQSPNRRREALLSAIQEHVIPGRMLDDVGKVMNRFDKLIVDQALKGRGGTEDGPLRALLGITRLPKRAQRRFTEKFAKLDRPVLEFWKALREEPEFTDHVDEIQFAFQLSALTANHIPLMQQIQRMRSVGDIKTVRDLAKFDTHDWLTIVCRPDPNGKVTFPKEIAGNDDEEKAACYAGVLSQMVQDAFPVESLGYRIQNDTDGALQNTRKFFGNVLDKEVNFDLGHVTISSFLEENPELLEGIDNIGVLMSDLQAHQRLFKIVPQYKQMSPILKAGLTSAAAISKMGKKAFALQFHDVLGGSLAAIKVHAKASYVTAAALNIIANLGPWFALPLKVLPWSLPDVPGVPDWESLFGTFDLCSCKWCRSVHSPAAYLAELLAYLKERKVEIEQSGGAAIETNLREILYGRRPDLGDLELTCENTNIPIPYVDLVNEVLENAISPFQTFKLPSGSQTDLDARTVSDSIRTTFSNESCDLDEEVFVVVIESGSEWFITDRRRLYTVELSAGDVEVTGLGYQTFGTEADLAANPSHVNADTYDVLSTAIHPWSLPLDLWTEETRVWLEKAGVKRSELMLAFQSLKTPIAPSSLVVACESIGLTKAEMEIITGTDPHQLWEFWGFTQTGNQVEIPDPSDPTKTITASLGWVDALSHVRPFMRQSDLSYDELLDLLASRFVNPDGTMRIESVDPNDPATCDTHKLIITDLTASVLDRLHRFVRLWRKLGWTVRELDQAVSVFQGGITDPGSRLVTRLIEQLAIMKHIKEDLAAPLERVLTLWGNIDTKRGLPNDPEGEDSLYDKLFLNPNVLKPVDPAFVLNTTRTDVTQSGVLIADHIPAILGGLEITATVLSELTSGELITGDLNLDNLSALFRRTVLADGMGLSTGDMILWKSLSGIDPFDPDHPEDTLALVKTVERFSSAGFAPAEVDYLLRHRIGLDKTLAPAAASVAQTLTEIRSGLQRIQGQLVIETDLKGDLTRKYLGLLKWDPAQIELVVSTLNTNPVFSTTLDDLPTTTVFPPAVQPRISWDPERSLLIFAGILSVTDRTALLGVTVPPALLTDYQTAVENIYKQSNVFLDSVRAYERPVFRAPLVITSMPANKLIPRRLKGRFFYDRKAAELCFSGLMLARDYEELSSIIGIDATFKTSLDQLCSDSSSFSPSTENEFLNEMAITPILASDVIPKDRFQTVLEKLVPRLRRLLGESLIKQKLSEALSTEPAVLDHLLDDATINSFMAPEFSESHTTLGIDRDRFPGHFDAYESLSKGSLVVDKLDLESKQLAWYFRFLPSIPVRAIPWTLTTSTQVGWLDFRNLPLVQNQNSVPGLFAAFLRFVALCETCELLRPSGEIALEEIFTAARESHLVADSVALTATVAKVLKTRNGWDEDGIKALTGSQGLALTLPEDFQDETGMARLVACQKLARRINALPGQACTWAGENATAVTSHEIKRALRARHGEKAWQKLAKPGQDIIREAKRSALVDYLVVRPPVLILPDGNSCYAWNDVNDLFGHFLIDVEMTACWKTSRIKQAISSVQLFVQRCLLNIETGVRINAKKDDGWDQWKWMKNYRVWEANRKIFLYPENWIEPELRDDKTPFFKELETEIQQNDLTKFTAEDAFLHYLEKLDTVARLELVGMYLQDAADGQQPILHVIGRTQATPAVHYYRQRVGSGRWTPWERVDLDIESDHLIPITWNRRLYLFWPVFTIKAEQSIPQKDTAGTVPKKYFEIQLAWSECKDRRWLPKKLTTRRVKSGVTPRDNPDDDGRNDHVFFAQICSDGLRIWPEWDDPQTKYTDLVSDEYNGKVEIPVTAPFGCVGTFYFSGGTSDAVIEDGRLIHGVFNPTGTHVKAMTFEENKQNVTLRLPLDETTNCEETALGQTPGSGKFQLLYAHQDRFISGRRPFFFEDQSHVFFILPVSMPTYLFNWFQQDSVDPGQFHVLMEHYYMGMGAGQPPIMDHRNQPAMLPLGNIFLTTTGDLTQRDLQLRQREDNIMIASAWLEIESLLEPDIVIPVFRRTKRYRFHTFYHPYLPKFIKELNKGGIDALLTLDIQKSKRQYFASRYHPKGLVDPDYPIDNVDFTPGGAYSQYNWELFFHAPMIIAVRLGQNQRFEEAQKWFHYIFDPTDSSAYSAPQKFWRTRPFHELQREDYLKQRIEQLVKPTSSGAPNPQLAQEIEEWRTNPFSPHAVARLRLTAYQKSVVMKYLNNLIAWADQLFKRDTIESINEATQLYILAADILGTKPTEMAPRAHPQVHTYNSLDPLLAQFSNSLVGIEYLVPSPSPDAVMVMNGTPALPIPQIPYFCIPRNDKLLGYWSTVVDRLFKIRHCMNIEGVVRQLALFAPPIDPGLLVKAAAAGVDIGSVLNDMNAPLPNYRFQIMAQKTSELCAEVKALGSALLSAIEKRDAEALSLLRSSHEISVLNQVRDLRKDQLKEATENVTALENGKVVTEARRDYYKNIARINANEKLNLDKLQSAQEWQVKAQIAELVAEVVPLIGDFDIGAEGWASSPVVKWRWGGMNIGMAAQAVARAMNFLASMDQFDASMASIKGGYDRRWDEWKHNENLAKLELKQVDNQITSAKIREAIAKKELASHDLRTKNAKTVDQSMRLKFSNRELYDWMVNQVSTLYFQSYQLAYEVARRAERSYRYELGVKDSNFIQFGYWDSLKKGLLAGERLCQDLKRMEISFLDQHKREYEITKHVSLSMLHPQALLSLRKSGSCFFELPEAIFDLDHPGHYFRRTKSVSLSLPCVVGPYTSVSTKLTLLGNRIRRETTTKTDGSDYAWRGIEDPRFVHDVGGLQSVVTSTSREDGGVFELNFRDERYLPFEGAGVISSWRLELPTTLRQFDYDSISDVVVHVRYTAREGGDTLKSAVSNKLLEALQLLQVEIGKKGLFRLFSVRHDFPDRWYKFLHSPPVSGEPPSLTIELPSNTFPAYTIEKTVKIKRLAVMVQTEKSTTYDPLDPLTFTVTRPSSTTHTSLEAQDLPGNPAAAPPATLDLGSGVEVEDTGSESVWTFAPTLISSVLTKTVSTPDGPVDVVDPDAIRDIAILCSYTVS